MTEKQFSESTDALLHAEWICENHASYDSRSAHVASTLRSIITDSSVAGNIRELGEKYIHDNYDKYKYENRLGEQKVIAVRYENRLQADAMLSILVPSTRYPNQTNDPSNIVRYIPWGKDGENRTSRYIVEKSWKSGISMTGFKRLENNTVIYYPDPIKEIRVSKYWYLSFDASNLKERFESKKQLVGDGSPWSKSCFPHVMVSGSDIETWCIDGEHSLHVASRPRLREIAKGCKTTEEFAQKLLNEESAKLVKKEYVNAIGRAERRGDELERIITR